MKDEPKFEIYQDENGHSEFLEFLDGLPTKDSDKLVAVIKNIEDLGLLTGIRKEWVKRLDKDIFEIRSKTSSNIQRALYFQKVGSSYIITHGFTKKTQKTPSGEIAKAHKILDKWREENAKH